ncbi:unnamed protein product [Amoebophrya sp. A120]|nr:unnamed protein product [Amoebophrya sp. A120]|eukprot:GSA120T00010436001.1
MTATRMSKKISAPPGLDITNSQCATAVQQETTTAAGAQQHLAAAGAMTATQLDELMAAATAGTTDPSALYTLQAGGAGVLPASTGVSNPGQADPAQLLQQLQQFQDPTSQQQLSAVQLQQHAYLMNLQAQQQYLTMMQLLQARSSAADGAQQQLPPYLQLQLMRLNQLRMMNPALLAGGAAAGAGAAAAATGFGASTGNASLDAAAAAAAAQSSMMAAGFPNAAGLSGGPQGNLAQDNFLANMMQGVVDPSDPTRTASTGGMEHLLQQDPQQLQQFLQQAYPGSCASGSPYDQHSVTGYDSTVYPPATPANPLISSGYEPPVPLLPQHGAATGNAGTAGGATVPTKNYSKASTSAKTNASNSVTTSSYQEDQLQIEGADSPTVSYSPEISSSQMLSCAKPQSGAPNVVVDCGVLVEDKTSAQSIFDKISSNDELLNNVTSTGSTIKPEDDDEYLTISPLKMKRCPASAVANSGGNHARGATNGPAATTTTGGGPASNLTGTATGGQQLQQAAHHQTTMNNFAQQLNQQHLAAAQLKHLQLHAAQQQLLHHALAGAAGAGDVASKYSLFSAGGGAAGGMHHGNHHQQHPFHTSYKVLISKDKEFKESNGPAKMTPCPYFNSGCCAYRWCTLSHDVEHAEWVRAQWLKPDDMNLKRQVQDQLGVRFASQKTQFMSRVGKPSKYALMILDLHGSPKHGITEFPCILINRCGKELGRFHRWILNPRSKNRASVPQAVPLMKMLVELDAWLKGFGFRLYGKAQKIPVVTGEDKVLLDTGSTPPRSDKGQDDDKELLLKSETAAMVEEEAGDEVEHPLLVCTSGNYDLRTLLPNLINRAIATSDQGSNSSAGSDEGSNNGDQASSVNSNIGTTTGSAFGPVTDIEKTIPELFHQWCNVTRIFNELHNLECEGLRGCLGHLKLLELNGLHAKHGFPQYFGMHDVENFSKVVQDCWQLSPNGLHPTSGLKTEKNLSLVQEDKQVKLDLHATGYDKDPCWKCERRNQDYNGANAGYGGHGAYTHGMSNASGYGMGGLAAGLGGGHHGAAYGAAGGHHGSSYGMNKMGQHQYGAYGTTTMGANQGGMNNTYNNFNYGNNKHGSSQSNYNYYNTSSMMNMKNHNHYKNNNSGGMMNKNDGTMNNNTSTMSNQTGTTAAALNAAGAAANSAALTSQQQNNSGSNWRGTSTGTTPGNNLQQVSNMNITTSLYNHGGDNINPSAGAPNTTSSNNNFSRAPGAAPGFSDYDSSVYAAKYGTKPMHVGGGNNWRGQHQQGNANAWGNGNTPSTAAAGGGVGGVYNPYQQYN